MIYSRRASPLRNRSGLVLGEGAAMVVPRIVGEGREPRCAIHADLRVMFSAWHAEHITRPTVAGQACAMTRALESARMSAGDVGSSTRTVPQPMANDAVETAAIKQVFVRARMHCPSVRQIHAPASLGAAGALEHRGYCAAIEECLLPPNAASRACRPNAISITSLDLRVLSPR